MRFVGGDSLQYTNEILKKMADKRRVYNPKYAFYYMKMHDEYKDKKYKNRSERIESCLDLWVFDKYEKNKILDLKKVNRCYNNRFCPNCKAFDAAKFLHYIKSQIEELLCCGYEPFLFTVTVPNVTGKNLSTTITKMNNSFRKLFARYNSDKKGNCLSFRSFKIHAALKTLEITYNSMHQTYHPHFHIMLFLKDYDPLKLKPYIQGHYSVKNKTHSYHSDYSFELHKVWTMIYKSIRLTKKNFDSMPKDPADPIYLITDMRPMDRAGFYEVVKYTVKDNNLNDYEVFKTLVNTLENRKIRQTYGELFDFDEDDLEVGEYQELNLEIEEAPSVLITRDIEELYTMYRDYAKISRFIPQLELENVEKSNN